MPRDKKKPKSARKRTGKRGPRNAPVLPVLGRKRELLVTETTRITTEPKVEIRKPATLAQALTEPEIAVVKPETKARVVRRTVRHRAA